MSSHLPQALAKQRFTLNLKKVVLEKDILKTQMFLFHDLKMHHNKFNDIFVSNATSTFDTDYSVLYFII